MPIQNHIHLSTTLDAEPEFSPNMKWKVQATGWSPVPEIVGSVRRTITGKLKVHHLTDGINPEKLMNWDYSVRVSDYWEMSRDERYAALLNMQGKRAYLIDHDHPADSELHTDYIRPVYVDVVSGIETLTPMLDVLFFNIKLVDDRL